MNFRQLREKYSSKKESSEKKKSSNLDPPPVLILRRIGIRPFPSGQRVALYKNKPLNLTFSVPYKLESQKNTDSVISATIGEQVDSLNEVDNLRKLVTIIKRNKVKEIGFENGSLTRVDPVTARSIRDLYAKLNYTNKRKVAKKLNSSPEEFSTIGKFAFKHLRGE